MSIRSLLAALFVLTGAASALAQPMTIVVPYPPGGSADKIARILSEGLAAGGAANIVANRPGAGGMIGSGAVARAKGDGKTVLLGQISSHVLTPVSRTEPAPYDPQKDFKPVVLVGYMPTLFVARPGFQPNSLKELVEASKTADPAINFGSSGVGTSGHVTVEMFKIMTGIDMTHVPYTGVAPILTDMLGGRIDTMIAEVPAFLGYFSRGVKPLAVVGPDRSALIPQVPTAAEQGFPKWDVQSWYGVFVPATTPEETRAELEKQFAAAIRDPDIARKLAESGLAKPGPASELQKLVDSEFQRWTTVFRDLKITN